MYDSEITDIVFIMKTLIPILMIMHLHENNALDSYSLFDSLYTEEEPDRSLLKKEDCNSSCHERSPCPVNSMYRCESGNVSVSWLGLKHNDQ